MPVFFYRGVYPLKAGLDAQGHMSAARFQLMRTNLFQGTLGKTHVPSIASSLLSPFAHRKQHTNNLTCSAMAKRLDSHLHVWAPPEQVSVALLCALLPVIDDRFFLVKLAALVFEREYMLCDL
jgi:hypothetical protein